MDRCLDMFCNFVISAKYQAAIHFLLHDIGLCLESIGALTTLAGNGMTIFDPSLCLCILKSLLVKLLKET
jgi:hypothetical protein